MRGMAFPIKTIATVICLSSALGVHGQQTDSRFDSIDKRLSGFEKMSPDNFRPPATSEITKTTSAPEKKKMAEAEVAGSTPVGEMAKTSPTTLQTESRVAVVSEDYVEETAATAPSGVLDTRLSELPPGTLFEFSKSLFVPAHKRGVMFTGGKPTHGIEKDADVVGILGSRHERENACVLLSDKSYVKMRGSEDPTGRPPTSLEVSRAEIQEATMADAKEGDQPILLATITFKPKMVKAVGDTSIQIKLTCRFPKHLYSAPKRFSLENIDTGVGGTFNYRLPNYIEL